MPLTRRQFISGSSALAALLFTHKHRLLANALEASGLKESYAKDFLVGTTIGGSKMLRGSDDFYALIKQEFNAITLENHMKWGLIHPENDKWDWEIADKFVEFGSKNDLKTIGHVLVWHSQMPSYGFKTSDDKTLTRDQLIQRMEHHIATLAGRYKNKIHAWDVVNEAIDEGNGWRRSPWYNIIGDDFMDLAFKFAHEADPNAGLLYNDYNMHNPQKRAFLVDWIQGARKRGVPINAVGLQGHIGLDYPDLKQFEDSIVAYAKAGMRVHITELDVDVLPVAWKFMGAEISANFEYSDELNPYVDGLPKEIEDKLSARYREFFQLLRKHRDKIDRVTFWGTGDGESWKNDFPVRGRTNYPLLFDRQYKRKPAYYAVRDLGKS